MTIIAPYVFWQECDNNGDPLAGGKVYTYEAGTSTPKSTYTDSTGSSLNSNPVILDSAGRASIWLGDGGYKFIIKTSADVTIDTRDNIGGSATYAFGDDVFDISVTTPITAVHRNAVLICTGTITLNLLSVATAGEGFYFTVYNYGSGVVTIDPSATETVNDAATITISAGMSAIVICDGDEWYAPFSGTLAGTVTETGTQTLTNKTIEIKDANFTIQDNSDTTKQVKFEASGVTTATTRTITIPDQSETMAISGKQTIWVPAIAMTPRTTNGAAYGTAEMTTNKNMVKTLDFDTTTQEFAQFEIAMPKSWNLSTVTFKPVWSHASTTTNFGCVWALQAVAISDDDTLDVAFGTEQTSTDTGGTTNDRYIGPESAAITVAGTPASGDVVQFQIKRNPSDGSDTIAIDARLHGVILFYTTNAGNDA